MNKLEIKSLPSKYKFKFKKEFEKILDAFQEVLGFHQNLHVDVLITDNKNIRKISKKYRNIDLETDVLSFPFDFSDFSNQMGFNFLGEIILSYEKIEQQSLNFNHSLKREFCFLFAHGLVHLSGRDHKKNKKEEEEFNLLVYKIMDMVQITREEDN